MKRIVVLFLLLLFVVTGSATHYIAYSQTPDIKSYMDIPGITAAEIFAVEALIEEYGSFSYGCLLQTESFELPDGTYAEFVSEFYALLANLFGAEFLHVYCEEWEVLKNSLENGTIGFTGVFTPIPQHHSNHLVSEIISGRPLNIYTINDSNNIKTESDLMNRKITFLSGTSTATLIAERYPGIHFEIVEANSFSDAIQTLETGESDAFIVDSAAALKLEPYDFLSSREIFPLVYTPVTLTTANPKFEPIITVFNKYLNAGGKEKLDALFKKGEHDYERYKLFKTFTDGEKAYIAEKIAENPTVDIGLQHDAYPVSFYNKNSREFQGIAIDILDDITELIGLEFTHITTTTDTPISTILEKLKTGEISMMTQLLYAESREGDYLWSDPYLETNYALLSKSDFPDLEIYQVYSMRVGTVDKTAHEEKFEAWFTDHEKQIKYDTTDKAFIALENGEIDLLMLSENMLLTQTNYREKPDFKINIDFYVPLESYFGFSKSEETLRSIVNKSLKHIKLDNIASRWLNLKFDYTKKINEVRTFYLSVFTIALLLLLIAMSLLFLSNKKLGRNLAERTAMLSTILSSIPDVVFCKNTNGQYTSCNLSFEKQAGCPESELIGKTYEEVFKERAIGTIDSYNEIDQRVLKECKTQIAEEIVTHPDGSRHTFETLKAPLKENGKIIGILGIGRDITERKEITTRLERIINTAQIVFLMTIDNKVIEANEYSRKHIGVRIGDDIRDFYGNPERRSNILKMADKHGTVSNITVLYKTTTGEVHRFLSSFTLIEYEQKNAYILWGIDIERDEQINDQLLAAQQTLQTIMDTLPLPVCIADDETHEIVYGNNMFAQIMEFSSVDELLNFKGVDMFVGVQKDGTNALELDNYLINIQGPVIKEVQLRSVKNNIVEVRAHAAPIDYCGKKAIIGFMYDLTNEKNTQKILIDAAEREKEANQTKSLFLANMSHEIRTPMNGIIGMTDLLLGEQLSGRQLQYAKDIKTSAESLLGIINDILDLSKISEGKLQITPIDIELSMLLENTISMIRFAAKSKGLEFLSDIHTKTPEYVRLDDVRLNQILVNLLSNAVKFTKKGYVKLEVKIENGDICFAVSDTGIGIKQEDIPLIFEVFEQVDRRKNRAIKGTGLGLSISRNLVRLMEGKMWVESEYGAGTTFHVTIPYVPGDETAVEKVDPEFKYIIAPMAQVLLVDDIQTNLTVGAGLLRLCGITADVAISGYEAISLVKEKDYDIVFMDHMMPDMDGIETMNLIREMGEKHKKLPIIALTANAVNESRDLLLRSGMNDFLTKPIDRLALVNILKKWLPEEKIETDTKYVTPNSQYSEVMAQAVLIEGLNIELALSRIGGMQDVLEASIKQVAYSLSEHLRDMDDYLSAGDLRGFAIKAHGLKGALANIGATRYSELAAALEIASKAENMPLCINKFSVFADTANAFADKLKALFESSVQEKKSEGNSEFLTLKVQETLRFLENFEDSDAMDCLEELVEFTYGEDVDDILNDAIRVLEAFDYEEAIHLLKGISSIRLMEV